MLMEVKKHLKLIGWYFKFNLSASMEYRTSFLIQVFGMFLNNASFAFFWWLLFEKVNNIAGYGFKDVMYLWSFCSASFGLTFILFGNLTNVTQMIVKGELDTFLLQPKDVVINMIGSKTNISAWGDLIYGMVLFLILNGLHLKGFLIFSVFNITGMLLYAGFFLAVQSLAFYFGNTEALAGLAFEFIITMSLYPEGIFHGVVRLILFSLIPAGFISMIPVKLLTEWNWGWVLLTLLVTFLWVFFAYRFFYRGLRKYESGNLMIQKI